MLENAIDRVTGHMHASIHAWANRRLNELVRDLLEEAVEHWAVANWIRYDEREVNCTIQLYRWLRESQRTNIRFHVLEVVFEAVTPTPGMLHAIESVTTSARSDLRIFVRTGSVIVEAKRLASTGEWCKNYVNEGMARFVDMTYAAADKFAMMVGYVQQPSVDGLRDRVNKYVLKHELMGPSHVLNDEENRRHSHWLASVHQRKTGGPIALHHLWIVLPPCP